MKARLIRFLFALHRWSGVVLGLLMLVWCLSGFVMIYATYPGMSENGRDLRVEGLAPIHLLDQVKLPEIPADAAISAAQIEMLADRPVAILAWGGGRGRFDLSTGEKIEHISEADAAAIAQTYATRHGVAGKPSVKQTSDKDEFTVSGEFNSGRPYYQVRLNDPAATMLYISSKSGEVRQRTTSSIRLWTWLGAIPHWLYFTELRQNGKLWSDVVIWTSLGGCFLTVLGLFVGIRQFRRRHSTGKLSSPYRGAKFWHHMLGLVFGLLVLTWVFSGFASMNPWGWLESGEAVGQSVDRFIGKPVTWSSVRPGLEAQLSAIRAGQADVLQISLDPAEGQPLFVLRRPGGIASRTGVDGQPAPFDPAAQERAAALLAGDKGPAKVELLTQEDDYYYKGGASGRLPVVRIATSGADTVFYLDPATADIRYVVDPGARGFRFFHTGLHRLDFFGWLRVRPVRDILVILLMLGVTGVCALGSWMGIRKLMRGGKLDNQPTE